MSGYPPYYCRLVSQPSKVDPAREASMHDKLVGGTLAFSIGVCAAGAVQAQQAEQQEVRQVEPFPVAVEVVQVVKQFDNPEGAIFSQDGAHVFISNAAEIGDRGETFGWTEGEGYIS